MSINSVSASQQQSIMDAKKVMTGSDARIYLQNPSGTNEFYAEAESFVVQMNVENVDVQPLGTKLKYAITSAVSFTIQISEMVVRDDFIAGPMQKSIAQGITPSFTFQAGAERWDGELQKVTLKECVPDGTVDLLNVKPGEVIKREMSFRINDFPDWMKMLNYDDIQSETPGPTTPVSD